MIQCPSCSSRIPVGSRFCSACGEEVAAVAGYAFWISLGGKPLVAGEALES